MRLCILTILLVACFTSHVHGFCRRNNLPVLFVLDTLEDDNDQADQAMTRMFWMDMAWWAVHATNASEFAIITAGKTAKVVSDWGECGNNLGCSTRKMVDIEFEIDKVNSNIHFIDDIANASNNATATDNSAEDNQTTAYASFVKVTAGNDTVPAGNDTVPAGNDTGNVTDAAEQAISVADTDAVDAAIDAVAQNSTGNEQGNQTSPQASQGPGQDGQLPNDGVAQPRNQNANRKPEFVEAFNLANAKFRELKHSLPKVMVVITDQLPGIVGPRLARAIRSLQDVSLNLEIFVVAKTYQKCNQRFIANVTTEDHCMAAPKYSDVKKHQLTDTICLYTKRGRVFNPPYIRPDEICYNKADIAILLDRSGSIIKDDNRNYYYWIEARQFLTELLNRLGVGPDKTRVALITFANPEYTKIHVNLDGCRDAACLQEVIWNLPLPNGKTDTFGAFKLADEQVFNGRGGDRHSAVDIIVVITDGKPVPENRNLLTLVDNMKINKRTQVIGVGVTDEVDVEELQKLSSYPYTENFFKVTDFENLLGEVERIQTTTCNRAAKPTPFPTIQCDADITIIVDRSASIIEKAPYEENWRNVKKFLIGLISSVEIGPSNTQISLMTFENQVTIESLLNQCRDAQCLINIVNNMKEPQGGTATDKALDTAERVIFQPGNGDRPNHRNIVIFMTDGIPNPYYEEKIRDAVRRINQRQIEVYGIGVTRNVSEVIMKTIVSEPWTRHYFHVESFTSLTSDVLPYGIITQACDIPEPTMFPVLTPAPPTRDPMRDCVKDVVIVLDRSGSIIENPPYLSSWELMQSLVTNFISNLNVGPSRTRVALVSFSNQANLEFTLQTCSDRECMISRVHGVSAPGGLSNFTAAFKMGMNQFNSALGDRDFAPDVLVIVTDGRPYPHDPNLPQWLDIHVRSTNTKVLAVGVTNRVDNVLMRYMVSAPSEYNYFSVPSYDDLEKVVPALVEETCRVVDRQIIPPVECDADILIMLDNSASITERPEGELNMNNLRTFALRLVDNIDVSQDNSRVAFMYFASQPTVSLYLDDCRGRDCVKQALWGMPGPFGTTNTAAALDMAVGSVFRKEKGDRRGHRDIIILVTDGKINPLVESELRAAIGLLRQNDITVFGVGVTESVDSEILRSIVSQPSEKFFYKVQSFPALTANQLYRTVVSHACMNKPEPTEPPVPTPKTAPQPCFADIFLMVDRSESIARSAPNLQNWNLLRQFLVSLTGGVDVGPYNNRFAMLDYADFVRVHFYFDGCNDFPCIVRHIQSLPAPYGKSDLGTAFRAVREKMFTQTRAGARKIVIVLADGPPEPFLPTITTDAQYLKNMGVKIISVAMSREADPELMRAIASEPKVANYFSKEDISELTDQFGRTVLAEACTGSMGLPPGGNPIFNLIDACDVGVDLIMLIDDSSAMSMLQYNGVKEWLVNLVRKMSIQSVKVAIAMFSDDVRVVSHLNSDYTAFNLEKRIKGLVQKGGTITNIPYALNYARTTMLSQTHGNRLEKDNVVVLVTAGHYTNRDDSYSEAKRLREEAKIITIGLANSIDTTELAGICSEPAKENFRRVATVDLLPTDTLLPNLCAGATFLCEKPVDLCFVWDTSNIVDSSQHKDVIQFISRIVSSFTVDENGARISLVTTGNGVNIRFNLEDFRDNSGVLTSLRETQYEEGADKELGEALRQVRNEVIRKHSRMFIDKYVVIITNSMSRNDYRTRRQAALLTQDGDVKLIVVNVLPGPVVNELVDATYEIAVPDYAALNSYVSDVQGMICKESWDE